MSALAGYRQLLRTTLRHDSRLMAPWVTIATLLSASSVLVYPWVFRTEADRQVLQATMAANRAVSLVFGPARDLTTADGFNSWRTLALGGFLAALCAIFAVTRATRAQEDSGRAELLASGVLGRGSRLLVGVTVAMLGTAVLGVVAALATVPLGGGWENSLLLTATYTATGWMFAGVAAVTSQLGADARTSNLMAVGTLGVTFVLRGFAYSVDAPSWTVWINPLGWMSETQPAGGTDGTAGNLWWPLALAAALTAVALAAAFALQARRDFGQGLVSGMSGPARGRVHGPWVLALRLNRGPIISWSLAALMLGFVFATMATSMPDLLAHDSAASAVLAAGAAGQDALIGQFLVTIINLLGITMTVPGVQVMLKVRSEEIEDRVEPIMAGAVRRRRYLGAHVALAMLSSTMYVLVAGLIIAWRASGADLGVDLGEVMTQVVVALPAVWTVVALSVAVVGARPRAGIAAWAGVLVSFLLTLLGPTFDLDDWVLGVSPFWHVAHTIGAGLADADLTGLGWISLVTVGFLIVGFVGFRSRDLAR